VKLLGDVISAVGKLLEKFMLNTLCVGITD
jgi:hypothetical protein